MPFVSAQESAPARNQDPKPVIFVSSTSDLSSERAAVKNALENFGDGEFAGMELFESRPEQPRETCLEAVAKSNIYIGIMGDRYGFIDSVSGLSMTELEYTEAIRHHLPCLIFLKNAAGPPPPDAALQQAFRERLKLKHTYKAFNSPDELATQVVIALHKLLGRSRPGSVSKRLGVAVACILVVAAAALTTLPEPGVKFDPQRLDVLVLRTAQVSDAGFGNLSTLLNDSKAVAAVDFQPWKHAVGSCPADAPGAVTRWKGNAGLCLVSDQDARLIIPPQPPSKLADDPLADVQGHDFPFPLNQTKSGAAILAGLQYYRSGQYSNAADAFAQANPKAWRDPYLESLYANALQYRDPSGCQTDDLRRSEAIYDKLFPENKDPRQDKTLPFRSIAGGLLAEPQLKLIAIKTLINKGNVKGRLFECTQSGAKAAEASQAYDGALALVETGSELGATNSINACLPIRDPRRTADCLNKLTGRLRDHPYQLALVWERIGDNAYRLGVSGDRGSLATAIDSCGKAARAFEQQNAPVDRAFSLMCVANATIALGESDSAVKSLPIYKTAFSILSSNPEAQRDQVARASWVLWARNTLKLAEADPKYGTETCAAARALDPTIAPASWMIQLKKACDEAAKP
jgi:tetratricopeptide (TPR) repeat protein